MQARLAADVKQEAGRHHMTFAQRMLEGLVQSLRAAGLALLQPEFHQSAPQQSHFHSG